MQVFSPGRLTSCPPAGHIDQEDYESVQALENVTSSYGDAYSVENVFINTQIVDNVNIRQAMLYALDRTQLIDGLLGGEGDLADGFAVPDGPYWKDLTPPPPTPPRPKSWWPPPGRGLGPQHHLYPLRQQR